jgi:hypothetical protein
MNTVNGVYNFNPNLIPLEEKRKQSAEFDKKIVVDAMDKPDAFWQRLKNLSFALDRHEPATEALNDARIVQLCYHVLRRLDEIDARLDALEAKKS